MMAVSMMIKTPPPLTHRAFLKAITIYSYNFNIYYIYIKLLMAKLLYNPFYWYFI